MSAYNKIYQRVKTSFLGFFPVQNTKIRASVCPTETKNRLLKYTTKEIQVYVIVAINNAIK